MKPRESTMKHYRITFRGTKERYDVKATSAQEACIKVGWQIGDCYVQGPSDKPYYSPKEE